MKKGDQYRPIQNTFSIENKIKQLELMSEKQSMKVQQLLHHPTSPRISQRSRQFLLPQSSRSPRKQILPQTIKKQQRQQQLHFRHAANIRAKMQQQILGYQQKMPLAPSQLHYNANSHQDQQMQYLKSEEYKKYLESLTKATNKQERVRLIKENRNNNVYMGKGGNAQHKRYNAEVSRRMTRQNLESARTEMSCEKSPMKIWERDQYREKFLREEANNRRVEEQQRQRNNQIQQQYSARPKKILTEARQSNQDYIRSVFEYLQANPSPKSIYPSENPSAPSSNRNQVKKAVDQYFPKQVKQSPCTKIEKSQNRSRKNKEKDHQVKNYEPLINNTPHTSNNIYLQEIQFCKKRNNRIEKETKTVREPKPKYSYKYRIVEDDKENYDSESEHSTPRLSNESRIEKENIYNISFKLDKPDQTKSPFKQQKYNPMPEVPTKRDRSTKAAKTHQKVSYNQNFKNKEQKHYQCTFSPLQTSQTRSTTTKTDTFPSKSSRKISVISRSKLKL